jgi:hypothetical protein
MIWYPTSSFSTHPLCLSLMCLYLVRRSFIAVRMFGYETGTPQSFMTTVRVIDPPSSHDCTIVSYAMQYLVMIISLSLLS